MLELAPRRGAAAAPILRLALCLALGAMSGVASADKPQASEAEMKLLPRYCPDTMGFAYGDAYSNTSPRAAYWVALMGKDFWSMHHYCWALISINRSLKAGVPGATRKTLRESALADYYYVLDKSAPDFIMLPEIYTRVGDVELLLARPDKAGQAFARARELKPDYWPAYSHWAEYLIGLGHRAEALKIVTAGLEHSPSAKVLLEQFRVLGGKAADLPKPLKNPPPPVADSQGAAPTEQPPSEPPAEEK